MSKKINHLLLITIVPYLLSGCTNTKVTESWDKELLSLIAEYAPKLELPYFYFGDEYEAFFNDAYGAISVATSYTDKVLIDDAKNAFEKDKYDWQITDNSNLDGYPSYTFSTVHDSNNYDIDLYIKNDYSRMEIYCYPYYDDEIKEFLKNVNPSLDINFDYYSQNFEEYSNIYTALEMAGDISDSKVTLENGAILNAGDLDYYTKTTTEGTRYSNCVYNAVGKEYKKNVGHTDPTYDSDYRLNHYLSEYGLLEGTWFEDYQGYGEYKNRELGYDINLWEEYKKNVGAKTDYDFFSSLLNLGQTNKFIETEMTLKVIYGDDMVTSVTHNVDGTTTCEFTITLNETFRESFGIYGIKNYPGLLEEMDAPLVDEYVCEAIFDIDNMLTNLNVSETKTILASKVTKTNSPWYGKEDFVLFKQISEETCKVTNAGSYQGELLFDKPMTAEASIGHNVIESYEHIYGTKCTFTASEDGTYRFVTTDKRCQLDFFDNNNNYLESCYNGQSFEIELKKDETISFSSFYLNIGTDFLFIGDVSFDVEKL